MPAPLQVYLRTIDGCAGRGLIFLEIKAGSPASYREIDLSGLEYLSRRLTLRLAYTSPTAGENWRRYVPRQRTRFWAVEAEIMESWSEQIEPGLPLGAQERLWKWIGDNVDYRTRS